MENNQRFGHGEEPQPSISSMNHAIFGVQERQIQKQQAREEELEPSRRIVEMVLGMEHAWESDGKWPGLSLVYPWLKWVPQVGFAQNYMYRIW